MTEFFDLSTKNHQEIRDKAVEVGWSSKSYQLKRNYITQNDTSKIKEQIRQSPSAINIYKAKRNREKLREITKLQQIDIIQNPGKNHKFRGVDKPSAEKAKQNNIIFLYTFKYLKKGTQKQQIRKITDFRKSIKVCEKYNAKYALATGAEKWNDVRSPQDLQKFIKSLNGNPKKAMKTWPKQKIREENLE